MKILKIVSINHVKHEDQKKVGDSGRGLLNYIVRSELVASTSCVVVQQAQHGMTTGAYPASVHWRRLVSPTNVPSRRDYHNLRPHDHRPPFTPWDGQDILPGKSNPQRRRNGKATKHIWRLG